MIIEDIYGNIITNPNLEKGRLEKAQRDGNTIYIYFPFNDDEQEAYNVNNQANITQDNCSCVIYESTKETITYQDTDPFCYAYARRIKREELTLDQCPEELQDHIQEILNPTPVGTCTINKTANNCKLLNLEDTYNRGETINFEIVPADNYRLPYYEEFAKNIIVKAKDDDGEELAGFFDDYCSWEEVEDDALVSAFIPSNCAVINVEISCVEKE